MLFSTRFDRFVLLSRHIIQLKNVVLYSSAMRAMVKGREAIEVQAF